jgi:hypothetical protein
MVTIEFVVGYGIHFAPTRVVTLSVQFVSSDVSITPAVRVSDTS